MNATVHDIYENQPHDVMHVQCLCCWHRWVEIHPVGTDFMALECPKCHEAHTRVDEFKTQLAIDLSDEDQD